MDLKANLILHGNISIICLQNLVKFARRRISSIYMPSTGLCEWKITNVQLILKIIFKNILRGAA